ncbi:pyridoxal-phosphate-dependent aminotransferase family protein [Marinibactrum halimedae]|uniref:Alanine--glyoxylate aminotransferase n=1 Tax=Marinibactrum halimedae TaxID=1444977 RepID=A0AA37TAL0_9GAMM|nr:alanine--glyoxylate aminotransferase family protein [Marinibactrum halimedae]MCD9457587.1 alanine--glyoxylate aminotransferase family protein [Marinibactrum halimedae]GLS28007.1 alanine--glyoxylate aminotransferase [Marinibactrum halimedae]
MSTQTEFTSFIPPQRTLMGPGPSDVSPRVLEALGRPTIGHLDPEFIRLMDETKQLLQYAFQTQNPLTMPISAPGSAGMEACFVNLLEPGDTAIVCVNGVFGTRMIENVERCGANAIRVDDEWGKPVDPQKVEDALKANPTAKVLAFVHAETSTGVRSDAEAIAKLGKAHNCLVIADTVTALGGIELKIDEWGIDAAYSGTQKCLSCVPGISPVTFSQEAVESIHARKTKVQSWFLDKNLVMGYWGGGAKRAYHHTAPVNAMYALHESLVMLKQEGLENAFARHQSMHNQLKLGLEELGIQFVVEESYRLPQLNSVWIPEGLDDATIRKQLLEDFNLEIGAGLGNFAGKVWRIGLMGYSAKPENVEKCISALKAVIG